MTETATQTLSPLHEQAWTAARKGDHKSLEEVWPHITEEPIDDRAFYAEVYRTFVRCKKDKRGLQHLTDLLEKLLAEEAHNSAYEVAWALASAAPNDATLRKPVSRALKGKHGAHPDYSTVLKACKGLPLNQALHRFESVCALSAGQVFVHAYWGDGVVKEVRLSEAEAVLDFPEEKGKVLAVEFLMKHLKAVASESFRALRVTAPDRLRSLGDEQPVELVRLAVAGEGGHLKQSALKELLLPSIIAESEWTSWWSRARQHLRLDPLIDFSERGGAHAEIALRSTPRTLREEIEKIVLAPEATPDDRVAGIHRFVERAHAPEFSAVSAGADTAVVQRLVKAIEPDAAASAPAIQRLNAAFAAEELLALPFAPGATTAAIPSPHDAALTIENYAELNGISSVDYGVRALDLLITRDGEKGLERAAAYLPKAPVKLAQAIWKELDKEHHIDLAVRAIQQLLEEPLSNPDTYLWAVKAITDGGWEHLDDYFPAPYMAAEILDAMEVWEKTIDRAGTDSATQAAAKHLLSRMRLHIQARNFDLISRAVQEATLEQARRIRRSVQNHPALADDIRAAADRQIIHTRKELNASAAARSDERADGLSATSATHYVTAAALETKMRELEELNSVKIPANAVEIEKARSEGDLRENAGYHGARERHSLLLQQAHDLQVGISTAKIFPPERVSAGSIGFGTAFRVLNLDTGNEENYTVLGRFETDPDRNIFSYQSPFMQQFLGAKVGNEVTVKHPGGGETRYRVTDLSNALAGAANN